MSFKRFLLIYSVGIFHQLSHAGSPFHFQKTMVEQKGGGLVVRLFVVSILFLLGRPISPPSSYEMTELKAMFAWQGEQCA